MISAHPSPCWSGLATFQRGPFWAAATGIEGWASTSVDALLYLC